MPPVQRTGGGCRWQFQATTQDQGAQPMGVPGFNQEGTLAPNRRSVLETASPTPHCGPSHLVPNGRGLPRSRRAHLERPPTTSAWGLFPHFFKNEFLYKEGDRDTNRDTLSEVEMEREPTSPERQHTERQGKSTLSDLIMASVEGRLQGFTLSQLWEESTQ